MKPGGDRPENHAAEKYACRTDDANQRRRCRQRQFQPGKNSPTDSPASNA
ncbi:hypothetical protein O1V64_07555 [Rouxiella badensis]|nr:hypothetical protein O1V64_07555 [Rouxiella badensis]